MNNFAGSIIRHRKIVITIFLLAAAVFSVVSMFVGVNYNMVDYLPDEAESTVALKIMNEEFDQALPNASVMIKNISIMEAVEYKSRLAAIDGVKEVLWLDDSADIKQPLEMSDPTTVESFYKDGCALFSVAIAEGMESEACAAIRELIGENNALSGEAAETDAMQSATSSEVMNAVLILVPIIILILVLATSSWLEPLLFLAVIGVSVLINMGTNIMFGEVSFMTNSITPILQLAVSLDYAIFLLHSFARARKEYDDTETAMRHAIMDSIKAVAASAATTVFGFIALVFMDFGIGADLGLSLSKGIVFSFLSVIVFLPALTLLIYKLLDRLTHRPFLPDFSNINRVLGKVSIPVVIILLIIIIPCFLGQQRTNFIYGNGEVNPDSRVGRDTIAINEHFGQSTAMVVLVPKGDVAKEQELGNAIEGLDHVTTVMSYANTVGAVIPPEYLGESIASQFYSENYARFIIYLDTAQEGEAAFSAVEAVRNTAGEYYDISYSLGQSTNIYDIKNTVQADNVRVNIIAVIAIFLVLLVSFKSAVLPFILLLTIESAIWINMAVPYFAGSSVNYIGYLILSTVQLGATVDYAILLTDNYMKNRQTLTKKEAIHKTLGDSFQSILVSAATLSSAGFILYATSSDSRVSDIGLLLGRGTLISMLMVLCFLPVMLTLFDKAINKLTWKAGFTYTK